MWALVDAVASELAPFPFACAPLEHPALASMTAKSALANRATPATRQSAGSERSRFHMRSVILTILAIGSHLNVRHVARRRALGWTFILSQHRGAGIAARPPSNSTPVPEPGTSQNYTLPTSKHQARASCSSS